MKIALSICCACIIALCQARAQTRVDLFVRILPLDSLDVTYYVPALAKPSTGFPALLFIHGFGEDKTADTLNCALYSRMGYVTMCYSVRGHGASSGVSSIMAQPERDDLRRMVEYVRHLPDVDSLAIGIIGGSQGGLHGLWAAADGLPVRAVCSDVIVPSWASDLFVNGSIRRTFMTLLMKTNPVRYYPGRDSLWDLLRRDLADSLRFHFAPDRDILRGELDTATVPMVRFLKWQDHYFGSGVGFESFARYQGQKKLYAGTGGHWSDPDSAERVFQSGVVTRWMNFHLRGILNGITDEPAISYAESTLPWRATGFSWERMSTDSWPPAGVAPAYLYFGPDSTLSGSFRGLLPDTTIIVNDYRRPWYTFDTAYVEGFKGPRFEAALPRAVSSFISPPLQEDVTWLGAPVLHADVSSDSAQWPFNAQIFEQDSSGRKYFINRINYTARHWPAGSSGIVDIVGQMHAHRFTKGNRLRVELTNIDNDPVDRPEVGGFPFVLPLLRSATVKMFSGAVSPAYLMLPCVGTPVPVIEAVASVPIVAELMQNYPNPFNPATTIPFRLNEKAQVTITIADILGREVAEVLHQELPAGPHTVSWDAKSLATGVYFACLKVAGRAEHHSNIRKMLLLK